MQTKIKALKENQTWKVVPFPPGKIAIDANGCIRSTIKLQEKWKDSNQGRVIFVATTTHWDIHQMDVYNAFLQGDLYEEVYMNLPQGFNHPHGKTQLALTLGDLLVATCFNLVIREYLGKSKKHSTIFRSSAEADKSTIQIAANPVFHECKKHINIDCHFICEKVQQGLVNILYLASSKQLANVFTTSLTIYQHNYLVSKLGMKNVFISPSLGGRGGYKGYCMY
ncbi:uncharacterized protein LOC142170305 [Nicotiana tabacum]|uniref:Uncharacterized protein LOC142170305 n=1 Tax=Nicotiana tabacum TaxID=4097 RepID=A0AC58STI9_TOBAC